MDYTVIQSLFEVGAKQADEALIVANGRTFRLLRPYRPMATLTHGEIHLIRLYTA
jgi:hypothetical protein